MHLATHPNLSYVRNTLVRLGVTQEWSGERGSVRGMGTYRPSIDVAWHLVRPSHTTLDCPHCGVGQYAHLMFADVPAGSTSPSAFIGGPAELDTDRRAEQVLYMRCASCRKVGIWLQPLFGTASADGTSLTMMPGGAPRLVWPHGQHVPTSIQSLPDHLQDLARQAFAILGDSPLGCVLVARRFVDDFLVDVLGADPTDSLSQKIRWAGDIDALPKKLVERVNVVCNVGNSGAHRRTDDAGSHVDVTDEDAVTLLAVVDSLAHWHEGERRLDEGVDGARGRFRPWWRPAD